MVGLDEMSSISNVLIDTWYGRSLGRFGTLPLLSTKKSAWKFGPTRCVLRGVSVLVGSARREVTMPREAQASPKKQHQVPVMLLLLLLLLLIFLSVEWLNDQKLRTLSSC